MAMFAAIHCRKHVSFLPFRDSRVEGESVVAPMEVARCRNMMNLWPELSRFFVIIISMFAEPGSSITLLTSTQITRAK
jgi:hypothetical protein